MEVEFYAPPGIRAKKVRGVLANRSVNGLLSAVCGKRPHRIASCAGDYGAITVWRDDDGLLRAVRQVRMATAAATGTITKRALAAWLREQLPLITTAGETLPDAKQPARG